MHTYNDVLNKTLINGNEVGNTRELLNTSFVIDPKKLFTSKKRLMSPYYLVGELLYNLRQINDLEPIRAYSKFWDKISDDGKTIRSAYFWQIHKGHGFNQYSQCLDKLKKNRDTRQAIMHLHHAHTEQTKDEICTLSIQFLIRDDKLNMIVNMRSNDIVLGLPYDASLFSLLHQMLALELNIETGKYYHNAGSTHIYNDKIKQIGEINDNTKYNFVITKEFIDELPILLDIEEICRRGKGQNAHVYIPLLKDDLSIAMAHVALDFFLTGERLYIEPGDFIRMNDKIGVFQLMIDYKEEKKNG